MLLNVFFNPICMKLDSADSLFSDLDGVMIRQPQQLPLDELWRQIREDANNRRERIGDQVGIFPNGGGFETPPAPPSHRGRDDDDDGDNGVYTFDM